MRALRRLATAVLCGIFPFSAFETLCHLPAAYRVPLHTPSPRRAAARSFEIGPRAEDVLWNEFERLTPEHGEEWWIPTPSLRGALQVLAQAVRSISTEPLGVVGFRSPRRLRVWSRALPTDQ